MINFFSQVFTGIVLSIQSLFGVHPAPVATSTPVSTPVVHTQTPPAPTSPPQPPQVTTASGKNQPTSIASGDLAFDGVIYTKADVLNDAPGGDYTSKSYEWVTGNETVDNWTTLITTHELSPSDPMKPLVAANYAQNVASMLTQQGATLLETSLINTPDAVAEGVDIKNPPYLLVYIFPGATGAPSELDIQRIEDGSNNSINSFIYGQRLSFSSDADLQAFLKSSKYQDERTAVVLAQVPQ